MKLLARHQLPWALKKHLQNTKRLWGKLDPRPMFEKFLSRQGNVEGAKAHDVRLALDFWQRFTTPGS